MTGYTIIGLALFIFVQSKNVYPQLLLARLFFSLGGSATSTMVTAILPSMVSPRSENVKTPSKRLHPNSRDTIPSPTMLDDTCGSETANQQENSESLRDLDVPSGKPSPNRLAGLVGLSTGCGALLALSLFLPLPTYFQRKGFTPGLSLQYSFYVVGTVSLVVALFCLVGLRNLGGKGEKGFRSSVKAERISGADSHPINNQISNLVTPLFNSIALGYKHPEFCLSYVGGFVARASSVGITLFIPLYVNAYYKKSGLCNGHTPEFDNTRKSCPDAYILAAKLTGVSQLVALIFAPIFGFLADRYRRFNIPLLAAACTGIFGYIGMSCLISPEPHAAGGTAWVYLIVSLLGISQIGAIVCSLGLLGHSILELPLESDSSARKGKLQDVRTVSVDGFVNSSPNSTLAQRHSGSSTEDLDDESRVLLHDYETLPGSYEHLKGSIAGVYSLAGGAGILILTKIGGMLFDEISPVAPFYLLALINGVLLIVGLGYIILSRRRNV